MEVIESAGRIFKIDRIEYEPKELYLQRCWFIIDNINRGSFDDLVTLSKIWINSHYYGMVYSSGIMQQLERMDKPSDICLLA